MNRSTTCVAFALCASSLLTAAARAQCADWSSDFATDGTNNQVLTLGAHDFGQGPVLVTGGWFSIAGDVAAAHVASWDGADWASFGSGLGGLIPCCDPREMLCSLTFDDGSGSALYIGGRFLTVDGVSATHIARFDGTSWSPVGAGFDGAVKALAVFDDGSGPALYAGGGFRNSGGTPMNSLARWDGVQWNPLGAGTATDDHTDVRALLAFDDGSGPALYFAGQVPNYNGIGIGHLGRWNGTSASVVGAGFDQPVNVLALHDDGSGPALYAGGKFLNNGGSSTRHVAKWNGLAWAPLSFAGTNGVNGIVSALASFDDGFGPALFVGGRFGVASTVSASNIAKWNGSSWSEVGGGVAAIDAPGAVQVLAVFNDGAGPALFVGGAFNSAGSLGARNLARWDGAQWTRVGGGLGLEQATAVQALVVADFGVGDELYAGGGFNAIGGQLANSIARFDGSAWHPLAGGVSGGVSGTVEDLLIFDDGTGGALYAAGGFGFANGTLVRNIAKWDGANWSALGTGLNGNASTLAIYDDGSGPALFVGGYFNQAGGASANYVAKWDGLNWSALGSGVLYGVRDLAVFDDGSGEALFAAGNFDIAGGAPADGLARWDGANWTPITHPTVGGASALAVFDDGSGPALYAHVGGGSFPNHFASLAKWDGTALTLVGGLLTPAPTIPGGELLVHDDGAGSGPELFVAGDFDFANGTPVNNVAAWNGTSWRALESGVTHTLGSGAAVALASIEGAGSARDLVVGGQFTHAGGNHSASIAVWRGCVPPLGTPYCFGDGSGTACPCGNASASGAEQGCAHSGGFGAQLGAAGSTSIASDDQVFSVVSMPANKACVLFVGNLPMNGGAGVAFGDGLRCAGPSVHRLGVRTSDTSGVASWGPGFSSLNYWSAGDTRYFQVWFRDPTGPCGNATNMSSALSIVFTN